VTQRIFILASELFLVDDYQEAKVLAQRVCESRERTLGLVNKDTLDAMNLLISILTLSNEYAEAEPLARRALSAREKLDDRGEVAIVCYNLANILTKSDGDREEALTLAQRAAALAAVNLPEDHWVQGASKKLVAQLEAE
jgi:hypothetical protein